MGRVDLGVSEDNGKRGRTRGTRMCVEIRLTDFGIQMEVRLLSRESITSLTDLSHCQGPHP